MATSVWGSPAPPNYDQDLYNAWVQSPNYSAFAAMPDDFVAPVSGFDVAGQIKDPAYLAAAQLNDPTTSANIAAAAQAASTTPTTTTQATGPVPVGTTSPIGATTMPQTNVIGAPQTSVNELLNLPNLDTNVGHSGYPEQSSMVQQQTQEMGTSEVTQGVTGTEATTAEQSFLDRMDPATRAAYEELLNQQLAGGSTLQQAQQTALTDTMTRLGADAEQYSMENAIGFAQGNVDSLTQELLEQIIPQIQGGASGTGSVENALAQIMSQNAAVKTGTAQQQAILEAVMGFGQLSQQGAQVTGQLATSGDPLVNTLMQLIETGKGATETGAVTGESGTRVEETTSANTLQQLINRLNQETAATSTQGLFQYPVVNQ